MYYAADQNIEEWCGSVTIEEYINPPQLSQGIKERHAADQKSFLQHQQHRPRELWKPKCLEFPALVKN